MVLNALVFTVLQLMNTLLVVVVSVSGEAEVKVVMLDAVLMLVDVLFVVSDSGWCW